MAVPVKEIEIMIYVYLEMLLFQNKANFVVRSTLKPID